MAHLVILGNGIAGVTTARHVRKRDDYMEITVISNESDYFFSRTALMYIFMGHMKYEHTKPYEDWFWQKNRINLVRGFVNQIDADTKTLHFEDGRQIRYDKLVVATGSKSNKFGWPGQDLPGVQGLYSLQDLETLEESAKTAREAVIVGGGLIGIELAEMLLSRKIKVTFLIREDEYWQNILPREEAAMIGKHIVSHGVTLHKCTNLKEILSGEDGRVCAVTTDAGLEIPCQIVGLTPGVRPNIDVVKNSKIATDRGVLVNEYLETNVPGVYAAGDCVEFTVLGDGRNRFEQLWYTGRMHGQVLARTLTGERTRYVRGIWFNSAKFMDIEYQTYGFVSNTPRDGEGSFYWEDPHGMHCLRIVHRTDTPEQEVVGMNFFGMRMRQDICQQWIAEKRSLEYVLEHLAAANFDPEFYRRLEPGIVEYYNRRYGKNLQIKLNGRFFKRQRVSGV